jgi:hypothetical protein
MLMWRWCCAAAAAAAAAAVDRVNKLFVIFLFV